MGNLSATTLPKGFTFENKASGAHVFWPLLRDAVPRVPQQHLLHDFFDVFRRDLHGSRPVFVMGVREISIVFHPCLHLGGKGCERGRGGVSGVRRCVG